ncbi:MAG: TlyA family RNA methyltransferase [Propionibacteriaceae bacterium]|nr:TlyA family RNA methyltransferase [Propionibacteriaceae bacterium]
MRLDVALVDRGLARSRNQAAVCIRQGLVTVDGERISKPSHVVGEDTVIQADADPWVSRAAHKLVGALETSGTAVGGRVLDAGASTGGFTQVCLQRGAHTVFAVDVGHEQLARELRDDPRVTVREGLNLRDLTLGDLDGEPVDTVVGDVSFISLRLILEPILSVLRPGGTALLLVKPQFEVGRELLGEGGVVRDPELQRAAVASVLEMANSLGWRCDWQGESVLPGTAGNVEFFVRLNG